MLSICADGASRLSGLDAGSLGLTLVPTILFWKLRNSCAFCNVGRGSSFAPRTRLHSTTAGLALQDSGNSQRVLARPNIRVGFWRICAIELIDRWGVSFGTRMSPSPSKENGFGVQIVYSLLAPSSNQPIAATIALPLVLFYACGPQPAVASSRRA